MGQSPAEGKQLGEGQPVGPKPALGPQHGPPSTNMPWGRGCRSPSPTRQQTWATTSSMALKRPQEVAEPTLSDPPHTPPLPQPRGVRNQVPEGQAGRRLRPDQGWASSLQQMSCPRPVMLCCVYICVWVHGTHVYVCGCVCTTVWVYLALSMCGACSCVWCVHFCVHVCAHTTL